MKNENEYHTCEYFKFILSTQEISSVSVLHCIFHYIVPCQSIDTGRDKKKRSYRKLYNF